MISTVSWHEDKSPSCHETSKHMPHLPKFKVIEELNPKNGHFDNNVLKSSQIKTLWVTPACTNSTQSFRYTQNCGTPTRNWTEHRRDARPPPPPSHFAHNSAGRCVFDLSVSAGPGQSEWAGGREKTKTGKQKTEGGPGPQGPSGPVPRGPQGGSKVVAQRGVGTSVGRSCGRQAGPVRSVDRVLRVVALMSWRPKRTETRLSGGLSATKLWLRRPVFVFCLGGPGPLRPRVRGQSPGDQKNTALHTTQSTMLLPDDMHFVYTLHSVSTGTCSAAST